MLSALLLSFMLFFFSGSSVFADNADSASHPAKDYRWERLNFEPSGSKYDDMYFIDAKTGWVVKNAEGEIHKTEDGGQRWSLQFKPLEQPFFRSIAFINEQIGFAGNLLGTTNKNPLYRTLDGGVTWAVVPVSPQVEGICGISIASPDTIYATGKLNGPAHVIKSNDGGMTWSARQMRSFLQQAIDIHFWNDRDGILVGGSSAQPTQTKVVILTTSDGGETWTERYRGPRQGERAWKISFPSRAVGYVSIETTQPLPETETEYFLKTVDGGQTWHRKAFYQGYYRAQGIGFVTENMGWIGSAIGNRLTMVTTDGGESWQETDFGERLNRFRFIGDNIGYAAGRWLYKLQTK